MIRIDYEPKVLSLDILLDTYPYSTLVGMLDEYWFCLDDSEKRALVRKALASEIVVESVEIPDTLREDVEIILRRVSSS